MFALATRAEFGNAELIRVCCGAEEDEPQTQMLARQESVFSNPPDRRAMRRFAMKLAASVRVAGIPSTFPTETENVSARGLFFYLDRWMTEGSRVEITMNFPPEVTLADPLQVRFLAQVIRVEPRTATRTGVAAMIEEYEFLQPEGTGASPGMDPGLASAG